MTATSPYRRRIDRDLVRDVVALLLFVAGVVGLSVSAFAVDWRLGLAALSVGVTGSGAYLGYTR